MGFPKLSQRYSVNSKGGVEVKTFMIYSAFILLGVLAASAVPFRVETPPRRLELNPRLSERIRVLDEDSSYRYSQVKSFTPNKQLSLFSPDIEWGSVEDNVPSLLVVDKKPTLSEKVHLIQAQCDTLKRKIEERKNGNSNQAGRQPN